MCDFVSRVGERHQRSPEQALLGQRDPVVASSCQRQLPRRTRTPKEKQYPAPPPLGGGVSSFCGEKPNSPLCGPVCGFGGRVGKRRQRSSKPALLGACGPVVDESGAPANRDGRKPAPSTQTRGRAGRRKAKKEKADPGGPVKTAHGSTGWSRWNTEFPSTQMTGLERAEAACIAETLSSGDRV